MTAGEGVHAWQNSRVSLGNHIHDKYPNHARGACRFLPQRRAPAIDVPPQRSSAPATAPQSVPPKFLPFYVMIILIIITFI